MIQTQSAELDEAQLEEQFDKQKSELLVRKETLLKELRSLENDLAALVNQFRSAGGKPYILYVVPGRVTTI